MSGAASLMRRWFCFNEARAESPGIPAPPGPGAAKRGPASMRPGLNRPGYIANGKGSLITSAASMRPGLNRPGYAGGVDVLVENGEASMRPGLNRPGYSASGCVGWRSATSRFNEARAESPGIRVVVPAVRE